MNTSSDPRAKLRQLERLLEQGRDGALVRFGLGAQCLELGEHERAIEHLRQAVRFDPGYSAAYKLLGRALEAAGRPDEALEAYRAGIENAVRRKDLQAAREMQVFVRRIEKAASRDDGA